MLVLALDTTTQPGSVALVDEEQIIDERRGDRARTHAERLPGELLALLAAHGRAPSDIDLFAVASGPGSFTGLRIGIATVQGLALVGGRPVVGISTLEVLGQLGGIDCSIGTKVAVWLDARRRDVFAALYRVTDAGLFAPERLAVLDGPLVDAPSAVLVRWLPEFREQPAARRAPSNEDRDGRAGGAKPPGVVWIGDGAAAFADAIERAIGPPAILPDVPLAGALGRMAIVRARGGGAVDPAAVRPVYVRRPDAEMDRERRACTTMKSPDTKGQS
jgi:tRNA threonylcarbamoyladenosine biosynthesis protein TsaB